MTPHGRGFVLLLLFAGAFGRATFHVPGYLVFTFAVSALGIAVVAGHFALPALALRRIAPAPASAGGELVVEIEVENVSHRTARDVTVLELELAPGLRAGSPAEVVSRLAPGERARLRLSLRCARRGAYVLRGLHAASAFPLGLWRGLRRYREESGFLVYPVFITPEEFRVPEGRNYQPGGILLSSNVGESSEFMHTREYRTGDNLRHIHWASTARLGLPVVRVHHEEYFVRVALVLDTEQAEGAPKPAQAGAREDEAFETALSLAAGIADNLSRRDYVIDLFAAGSRVYRFQAGRALATLEHVLEVLACLEPAERADWEALSEAVVPEASRLTGVVALFLDWTDERARLVATLEARGVAVRAIVVRDGPTSKPPPAVAPESFVCLPPRAVDLASSLRTFGPRRRAS